MAKLDFLRVFEHIWLAFPQKGHTHGPLDAVFGQATVKMANNCFDDDVEVREVLQKFLDRAEMESGTCERKAYKLDEAAEWGLWGERLRLKMSNLTNEAAPHSFHICHRQNLSLEESKGENTAWPGAMAPHPGDLVVAIRRYVADMNAYQVALIVPNQDVHLLKAAINNQGVQPTGIHGRRQITKKDCEKFVGRAKACHAQGGISDRALAYLTEWASGTRVRNPRPVAYNFLYHRVFAPSGVGAMIATRAPTELSVQAGPPRKIVIHSLQGAPLPEEAEEAHEHEDLLTLDD